MLGGAIFVATFGVFLLEHSAIAAVNGWWFDELFSIWSSNPAEPFSAVFMERIEPDTTPPLYGSLLYWARALIKDDRQAIFVLNTSAILIAAIAVILSGRSRVSPPRYRDIDRISSQRSRLAICFRGATLCPGNGLGLRDLVVFRIGNPGPSGTMGADKLCLVGDRCGFDAHLYRAPVRILCSRIGFACGNLPSI
jgi:hypothetical protein